MNPPIAVFKQGPVTYLPHTRDVVHMLPPGPCPSSPDKMHCPYCGICDARRLVCTSCQGKMKLGTWQE